MQFEGEHKVIPLRGIERAMENGVAQDGGMNEVINLIPRNGSYVPYAPTDTPTDHDSLMTDNVNMVRIHHTSTGDNTIVVMADHYLVNGVRKEGVIHEIVFIGNRMDLSTENGIEHWLWKNGEYINQDDLNIHMNGVSGLPYVNFKVERGIYDGSKVYQSARYVKVHKHFTDADAGNCDQGELSKYVRELGSVGSDAMALLDSIRHMGGITGYVLVTAAWRLKGSDASNPKYVMASPVLLMGAPEIYMKENQYEVTDLTTTYVSRLNVEGQRAGTYLLDMFDYQCEREADIDDNTLYAAQTEAHEYLWNISDSDDREIDDMSEGEHVFIEPLEENDKCVIRVPLDPYRVMRGVIAGQGDQAAWTISFVQRYSVQQPALCSRKYALYDHGTKLGTDEAQGEYRGVRITHGSANVLYYRLSGNIAEQYKDEIDRLCIFVSPVVSPYKSNEASGVRFESDYVGEREDVYDGFFFGNERNAGNWGVFHSACGGSFTPIMKSNQEIRDELKNIAGLYKVAELQLNELQPNQWLKINLSGGRLATDKMVQHSDTMLKMSDIQPVGFNKGHIFGYNERLHVYNFQKNEIYRLPYKAMEYYYGGGQYNVGVSYGLDCHIEVEDSNGSIITYPFNMSTGVLNPLITCADIDAKNIRVVVRLGGVHRVKIANYTPIEIGGFIGGYISDDLTPIKLSTEAATEEEYNAAVRQEYISPESYSYGRNEIRVSNTGTTIFEVDKSYRVGHGEIIALARLSMGLSQDNYSKFPLVVFCTDGIYTLGVDASGKYAYSSQDPLSRVVCTNPNGICEIDGAVLFPTEYGLQMVTMDGVKPVVTQVIGTPKNLPIVADGLEVYRNAIRHEKIVQLMDDISWEDFLKDIQYEDTYIRYLHAINSVVIYNRYKPYSYLVDLKSWSVTKLEQRIAYDDGDFPKQTFRAAYSNGGELKSVQFDYYSGADNAQCLLVTRPIALESRHLKTAYRVVMRGAFEYDPDDEEERYAGLYAFGSLDGNHWDYLNGVEKLLTSNRFHDLGIEVHHVSYKYMMLVFAGTLSKDSHIDGLEITSRVKYNNKLK